VNGVEDLRADGPIARALPRGRVPVPEVVLVALAVMFALVAAASAGWELPLGPPWAWLAAAVVTAALGRLGTEHPRLSWPVPALLRLLEYGAILLLVGSSPWAYALAATVAFHHYDIVYRGRTRGVLPPRWLMAVTGGWELRTVLLVAAAALGEPVTIAATLTTILAPIFLVEAVAGWTAAPSVTERR
jgi:hypothetical protein